MDLINLKKQPALCAGGSVVGRKEFDGPLGEYFSMHSDDDKFGMKTWEKSENEMARCAINLALTQGALPPSEIDAIFAGDLMNQCTASAYGLLDIDAPYFGLYGACSTMAEGLILGSLAIEAGVYKTVAACTSSHNCTSERQFRFPVEYGGQRTPTSQWTVTGAASVVLSDGAGCAYITQVLPGRSVEMGVTDINNMGAAMAPAAHDTLLRYFTQSGMKPEDFDLVVTGDLGAEGAGIVTDFMKESGYDISTVYNDCGLLIYDTQAQDVHSGGSGCGCSGVVLAGYIMQKFRAGEFKEVLFVGTGALMSPLSLYQGEAIPGVAHLIRLSAGRLN